MKLDAYGRLLEVVREDGSWVIYILGEGKKRRSNDVVVPAELSADEVVSYLEDILHEAASPARPRIRIIAE